MSYNLNKKTIIVTGANSGIGKAAVIHLAKLGANVIMACRSSERGDKALDDVRKATNSDKIELLLLDLSSQASIHRFVRDFKKRYSHLDVLIHNAANFDQTMKEPILSEDGIETIFATNHVGIFLMTHLLLDMLQKSAPSRIITVASKGLIVYPALDIDFENLNGERKFSAQHAYYQSKQAQLMFTYALAEKLKGTGVTVNCVRVTNVALPDDRISNLPKWVQSIYRLKRRMSITPEQQAKTYVYLAADPTVQDITGGYFDEKNRQVRSNQNSYDRKTWKKLWEVSEKLAGI
jgi:NAD(P)-dependent dehydrogenase (short-subunit alcohol dehydrogenase family)